MKSTMQYSVGGNIYDVADDRYEEFLADALENYEEDPEEVYTFWVDGREVKVKESRLDEFYADAKRNGATVRETSAFTMDDGETLRIDDEAARQFVQARRTGQAMSRGLLKQTGIPEQYGRSAADREALADLMAQYYPEDKAPDYGQRTEEEVLAEREGQVDGPAVSAAKGFAEGLKRSVTDAPALWEETYGDGVVANALKGAGDFANRIGRAVADVPAAANDVAAGLVGVGERIGGGDGELSQKMRDNSAAWRQEVDEELPTDTAYVDERMKPINDFAQDTLVTIGKFAVPGMAPVAISSDTINAYYDAYERAISNGHDEDKAEAFAAAKSGATAAMGLVLGKAAKGARSASGFKGALTDMAVTGGEMGALGGVNEVIDQGIEGNRNPDWEKVARTTGIEAAKGAAFSGMSRGIHALGNERQDFGERRFREEQEKEQNRIKGEKEARDQYDRTMSDETAWQLEREIQEQVDAGTIAEGAKERVKSRVEGMFDSKRTLDNAELREAALMKAIGEEQTPTRVESAAHERRTVEAKMRENEYWAKRSEELEAEYGKEEAARKVAEEQAAVERKAAADEIEAGEREARDADLAAAFAEMVEPTVAKPDGKGRMKKVKAIGEGEGGRLKVGGDKKPVEAEAEVKKPSGGADVSGQVEAGTDEGFRAWAVNDRTGKPLTFATPADEAKSRELFEMQVRRGKVDGKTGKKIDATIAQEPPKTAQEASVKPEGEIVEAEAAKPVEEVKDESFYLWRKKHGKRDSKAAREEYEKDLGGAVAEAANGNTDHLDAVVDRFASDRLAKIPISIKKTYDNLRKKKPEVVSREITYEAVEKYVNDATGLKGESAKKMTDDLYSRLNAALAQHQQAVEAHDAEMAETRSRAAKNAARSRAKNTYGDYGIPADIARKGELEVAKWVVSDKSNGKYKGDKDFYDYCKELVERDAQMTPEERATEAEAKDAADMARWGEDGNSVIDKDGRKWTLKERAKDYTHVVDETSGEEYIIPNDDLTTLEKYNGKTARVQEGKGASAGVAPSVRGTRRAGEGEAVAEAGNGGTSERMTAKEAAKMLGLSAYDKAELEKKLAQWEANPTDANAKHREAAKLMLGRLEGEKKAEKASSEGLRQEISDTPTAAKLQDADFKAWAAKKGCVASDGARREYDAEQVDALGKHVAKNWMKGVTFRRSENAAEVPGNARQIYSKDGNVIGWYDGAKKEVVTLPGADAGTVAHELGWHATYDHAKELAAKGNKTLLEKLRKYADEAPVDIKLKTKIKYSGTHEYNDKDAIIDEIGAARYTLEHISKIKDAAARRQAAQWYERAWNAVADTYKSMLSKMGWNKARLEGLNALTPEATVDLLAKEMLKGRTLGEAKKSGIDMEKGETILQKHSRVIKDALKPLETLDKDAGNSTTGGIHTKMRLLPGKVQAAMNDADSFANGLKKEMKKAGVTAAELNEYMYAMAAGERNAKVLARNGTLEGSAMSHADIKRVLDAYKKSSKHAELERMRQEVLKFQQDGFNARIKAGLISRAEANRLMAEEPNHVPMKSRFDADGNHTGFDRNATFGKPEWKKAEGRTNIGDGPLEWILQEYVDAKSHAAKNDARQSLLATVLAHPEMGTVRKLRPGEALGEITSMKDKSGEPNTVIVKSNGDTYKIMLNGTRGELIARAMTGRGIKRQNKIVQNAMRWWSSTATEWSPTFAARNFLADTIDVFAVNTSEHGIVGGAAQNAKHVWNAAKMAKDIGHYVKTGETSNATLREAIDAGVLMGGGVRSRAFDADAGLKTLKTDFAQGKNRAKAVGKFMFGWVNTLNQTAEMMNRMADYKLQRDAGKSKNEAALHAREITVDFNQKGELTPIMNSLYMFSNSALGSTMRLNKALFNGKNGAKLAAGTFALGLIEGFAESEMNGDDEEGKNVNEYTRATSLYVRNGKDIYRVPMHASPISLIKYAGNCTARKLKGTLGKDRALNQIADDGIGILTQFAGIGDIGDNWKSGAVPTIIQPIVQAWTNRDFADRPIEKTAFNDKLPKSHNGRKNTPEIYKEIAKAINAAGGGNEGRKGKMLGQNTDFSPEMIKHFAEGLGKNTLRDVANVEAVIEMALGKSEADRRNIPVVRDYFRTAAENDDRFFKAMDKYKEDLTDFNNRASWAEGEKAKYMKDRPWLYKTGSGSRTVDRLVNGYSDGNRHVAGINDLRKMEQGFIRKKGGGYAKHEWTEAQVEQFKKRRLELQKKVIDKMGL